MASQWFRVPAELESDFRSYFCVFFGVLHAPLTALKAMSPKGMTAGGPASGARTKRSEVAAAAGVTFETGRGPLSQRWAEGKVAASSPAATAEPEPAVQGFTGIEPRREGCSLSLSGWKDYGGWVGHLNI